MWREVPSGPWNLAWTSGLRTGGRGRGPAPGRGRGCCRRQRRLKYQHSFLLSKKEKEKKYILRSRVIGSLQLSPQYCRLSSLSIIVIVQTINIDRSFKVTSYSNNTNPFPSNDIIKNYCLQIEQATLRWDYSNK